MNFLSSSTKGFSLLLIIIVLSGAMLLLALTSSMGGIDEAQNVLREQFAKIMLVSADGCLNDALLQLNQSHSYSGETLTLNGVVCTITLSGADPNRTIDVGAVNGTYTRHLQADANWNSGFAVTAWRDMTN